MRLRVFPSGLFPSRPFALISSVLTLAALPASALAAPPVQPDLGGGFIEFLFTGHTYDVSLPFHSAPPDAAPANAMLASRLPAVDPQFDRQLVAYDGPERPGTIIVDTGSRFLFLVQPDGQAMRYGVGVGREGFEWHGRKTIERKAEWPDWHPPADMLRRRPELPTHMAGGIQNPLGARALYLGGSLYRIHGSNEPWSIGQAVSSGCIRMRNEDVIDLYQRVTVGTSVVVL